MKQLHFNTRFASSPFIVSLFFILFTSSLFAQYPAGSPVAINGKLKVTGTHLVNECGNPVQLRGASSHGVQWFPDCYNESSITALANDWGADVFRIAMYVQEGGYVTNPPYWKSWIDNMVAICGSKGIYCIIDWHVLNPGDPNANLTEARDFWSYMSAKHAADKHVLYEICNEPNGVSWNTIKSYANDIIPRIRANDPNTVIICGTPTYSQDVDVASADPLAYSNITYALHFYSGTHTQYLRDKGNTAIANGAALFVSECGTSTASGDGGPYLTEMQTWIDWMAANTISWANWNFADKSETSSALNSGSCASASWNNTSASGTFMKQKMLSPADDFVCGSTNAAPMVSLASPVNGTTYKAPATIALKATATDADGSIRSVAFYNGAALLNTDTVSPYAYNWTNVGKGTYSLTARATDNKGSVTVSSAVTVTVADTLNKAPTVTITSPAGSTSYKAPASVVIKAIASDADGTISSVSFYNGTTLLGTDATKPYSYTWSGVGAGTYPLTAVAKDNGGATQTSAAVSITVTGTATTGSLKVQYKTPDASAGTNTLRPWLQVVNTGTSAVPLSELTLRYWYTSDGATAQNFYCDWAAAGCGVITSKFVTLPTSVSGANGYVQLGFASGTLAANGTSGEIQDRIAKADWSNYTQTGDYSFDGSKTSYADWSRITLYRNGVLVWGTEPTGTALMAKNDASAAALQNAALTVQPNPAKNAALLLYTSPAKERILAFVYTNAGVPVMQLSKAVQPGTNTVHLDVSRLAAGSYYVGVVPVNGKMIMRKMELVK